MKFKVTKLSHPLTAPPIIGKVALLLLETYVFPSIHVIGVQEDITSVPVAAGSNVKFKVTKLSHPPTAPPTIV